MKKIISLMLVLVMLLGCCAVSAEPVLGGWSVNETPEILDDDILMLFAAAADGWTGSDMVPIALLGMQVVAGVNYCFLCKVTPVVPDAESHLAYVYIYESATGEVSIVNVADIDIGAAYGL